MTKSIPNSKVDSPWLSSVLLMAAYITYGGFLHSIAASRLGWAISLAFAVALAAVCTICWGVCRRIMLMGFQSDAGYFIMALLGSSLAVAAVSQFRMFSYLSLLVAVALLTRVDMLIADFPKAKAFVVMLSLSLLGLGLARLLYTIGPSSHVLEVGLALWRHWLA